MIDKETYAVIDSRGLCMALLPYNPVNKIEQSEQENAELKAENERLKEENEKLNKMTGVFSARLCEKYRKTLQEIKKIAEDMYEDYSKRWDDNISEGLEQIIDLITKAEVE